MNASAYLRLFLTATLLATTAQAADEAPARRSSESTELNPEPADLAKEIDPKLVDGNRSRYLPLYIGIPYSERLDNLPNDFSYKGDFRGFVGVKVNRETNTLVFEPRKEGFSTLTILDKRGAKVYEIRLDVKKSNLTKVAREIRALLSDIEGITFKIVNNRVIVDGQILLPRDMNRIHTVLKQYNGQADSLVTLSPLAEKKIAEVIAAAIGNPEIQVSAVNGTFILEGQAGSKEEKDRAEIIAKTYVPDVVKPQGVADGVVSQIKREFVINLITLKPEAPKEPGKVIQLVVHFVELNKNYQNGYRFQFTPSLEDKSQLSFTSDSRGPGGVVSTLTGIVSNLLPKLNWSKTHGHARILQSTSIIVLDGKKGDIRSTVRLPYQVVNAQGQPSTNFEEAGIISTITPAIVNPRSDSIKLTMDFSMASLLGITDQGPMISKSTVQTEIVVRSGQSAAVGGLIANSTATDYNKLPKGASENPIISLYASKSFQRNQSQFVVFVTPIIKSSASAGAEKIKRKMRLRD